MSGTSLPVQNRFSATADLGLRVIPIEPFAKKPAKPWSEYSSRPASPDELATWDASNCNVGIICGAASGIVVLDVDSPEAQVAVDELELPATPCVKTAKGMHYYFKSPEGEIRNRVKIAGLQLDFRGDGGYVVGPGSIHPSGAMYKWVVSPQDVPFAELPIAVLELLAHRQREGARYEGATADGIENCGKFGPYLCDALATAVDAVRNAGEGARNDSLFRAGVRLANDVAAAQVEWSPFADGLKRTALEKGLTPNETEATLASCWKTGSATPTPWIETARQWIYLSRADAFYHAQSGEIVKVGGFNNTFAGQRVARGTFANFLLSNQFVEVVHDLDYQPTTSERYIERDRLRWFNTYRPSEIIAASGDAQPFIDFVSYLVPQPIERDHLLKMIAWTVRNPGHKLRHALLLRSTAQGIGKTMLVEIWGRLLGKSNVRKTTTEEISGQYQGFIKETLLVVLEELNWGVGPTGYNRLKDLITGSEASVNEKFLPVRTWPNVATLVILTNVGTPMILEDHDRRFFYIDTPAVKREPEYYRGFAAWWENNLGVIRAFLDAVDLTTFDPYAEPPMTDAKMALISESRPGLVKDLVAAMEERSGAFNRDIASLVQIETELGTSMRGKSKSDLVKALEAVGAVSIGQCRVPPEFPGSVRGRPGRASLWVLRNVRFWKAASANARGEEFRRQEGLLSEIGSCPIEILHESEWPLGVEHFRQGVLDGIEKRPAQT